MLDAKGSPALLESLRGFKEELLGKQFSASSTDKLMIDANAPTAEDSVTVARLMNELVTLFGQNWSQEQDKQKAIGDRFKAKVPLLILIPMSFKAALASFLPFAVLGVIVSMALLMALVSSILASAVISMNVEAVPVNGRLWNLGCRLVFLSCPLTNLILSSLTAHILRSNFVRTSSQTQDLF